MRRERRRKSSARRTAERPERRRKREGDRPPPCALTVGVVNFGTITGEFSGLPGSDINGPGGVPDGSPDGDGDGVDIDELADIENHGIIAGTGAGGNGSDGLPNTAEGVAVGGGTILNDAGASIRGRDFAILVDDSSQGNAPFRTTIVNSGEISSDTGVAIKLVSTFADSIVNNGRIAGAAGTAILFGNGDDTLSIGPTSVVVGLIDGQGGTDTLDYSGFGSRSIAVNLTSGSATGTGGVGDFENVTGGPGADNIRGDAQRNVLAGRGGSDVLSGNAGNDVLHGGMGLDTLRGGPGADQFVFDTAPNGQTNADRITDFSHADHDKIVLRQAIFTHIGATLDKSEFALGNHAFNSHQHILYNPNNGQLFFDADGSGSQSKQLVAVLDNHPSLGIHDFMMIA